MSDIEHCNVHSAIYVIIVVKKHDVKMAYAHMDAVDKQGKSIYDHETNTVLIECHQMARGAQNHDLLATLYTKYIPKGYDKR